MGIDDVSNWATNHWLIKPKFSWTKYDKIRLLNTMNNLNQTQTKLNVTMETDGFALFQDGWNGFERIRDGPLDIWEGGGGWINSKKIRAQILQAKEILQVNYGKKIVQSCTYPGVFISDDSPCTLPFFLTLTLRGDPTQDMNLIFKMAKATFTNKRNRFHTRKSNSCLPFTVWCTFYYTEKKPTIFRKIFGIFERTRKAFRQKSWHSWKSWDILKNLW